VNAQWCGDEGAILAGSISPLVVRALGAEGLEDHQTLRVYLVMQKLAPGTERFR
jgi:hypothetical protein